MKPVIAGAVLLALAGAGRAHATVGAQLADFVGYTVVHAGQITGWIDAGGQRGDGFIGCDEGRQLVIDNRYTVTCQGARYAQADSSRAVLLAKDGALKLIVNDVVYGIRKAEPSRSAAAGCDCEGAETRTPRSTGSETARPRPKAKAKAHAGGKAKARAARKADRTKARRQHLG